MKSVMIYTDKLWYNTMKLRPVVLILARRLVIAPCNCTSYVKIANAIYRPNAAHATVLFSMILVGLDLPLSSCPDYQWLHMCSNSLPLSCSNIKFWFRPKIFSKHIHDMHEAIRYQFEIYWFRALQYMDTKRRDVVLFTVEYTVWGLNKCNIAIKEKLYHLWKTFVIYRNM